MKIILLQDIKALGKKGDTKEVPDGYGRNFLIPRKLAALATPFIVNQIAIKKKQEEEQKQEEAIKARELAIKLKGQEIKVPIKAGENGKAFGSVTASKIVSALKKAGFDINKSQIVLEHAIKTLGVHNVEIDLGNSVKTEIKVIVEAEAEE